MRITLSQLVVGIILTSVSYAETSKAQSVLEKRVTMQFQRIPLQEALRQIEKNTAIKFIYSLDFVQLDQEVSLTADGERLSVVLDQLLKPLRIHYKAINDRVVLRHRRNPKALLPPLGAAVGNDLPAVALTVRGRVVNDAGEGLPGVSVLLKGTTTGTTSDGEGAYALTLPEGGETGTLVFSFIGYATRELPIDNRSTLDVSLLPDVKALGEVVVVGYGTQQRQDLTGSVATVKGSDVSRLPVSTVTEALQGQAPGVEITSNSGAPGANLAVRIRGVGTINSTDPLYVVDGLPIFGGLNQINPNDIESIDILKDASAGAIYGARAANGVVLITTKKGQEGPLKVSFNAYYGSQSPWRKLDLLNAGEYRALMLDVAANGGKTPPEALTDPSREGIDTDWQDLMFQTAPIQSYNLGLSGGGKFATFNISGGYFRQEGIQVTTRYDRANVQINSQGRKGRFRFGETLLLAGDVNKTEPNYIGGLMLGHTITASPLVSPFNPGADGGYGGADPLDGGLQFLNPYGYSMLRDQRSRNLQVLGSVYGQFEILPGLDYRLNLGTDLASGGNAEFIPSFAMGNISQNQATLSNDNNNRLSWLAEHTLTFSRTLGRHQVTALAGYSDQYLQNYGFRATAVGFPNNDLRVLSAGSNVNKSNDGSRDELHLRSFFGRVNYTLADRYLLTATVRRDGSSNFSKNNRYGTFPSVSLGWVLSEEAFLKDNPLVSLLKLRASYGLLGNQAIGPYNYSPTLNVTSNYPFGVDQEVQPGTAPRRLPSDARWETTKQADVGLELGLLRDKLVLVADYFHKQTEGMLITAPNIPLTTGLPDKPAVNAGGIENQGLELALTYRKSDGPFTYSVTGNFTTYRNRVTSLGNNGQPLFAPSAGYSFAKTEVGSSIGRFYGYVADGLYQTDAEIDKTFAPNAAPGDIRFRDLNGDGKLDDKDRDYIGSPLPDFSYGLSGSVGYGGLDLSLLLYGVAGNQIVNRNIPGMNSSVNTTAAALRRWTPENPNTDVPRAVSGDPNNNYTRFSSRYIEDGSFLRLRNVTVGYTLPASLTEKLRVARLRLYVSGQNLLTLTKYSGFDPETAGGSQSSQATWFVSQNLLRGVDNGASPPPRTLLGGLQLDF
jgi:TonB-linked SusC/RagA family outer membrane protein